MTTHEARFIKQGWVIQKEIDRLFADHDDKQLYISEQLGHLNFNLFKTNFDIYSAFQLNSNLHLFPCFTKFQNNASKKVLKELTKSATFNKTEQ